MGLVASDYWHALALGKRDEAFTLFQKLSPDLDEALKRWRVFLYQLHAKARRDILNEDPHALNKKSLEDALQFWARSNGRLRQELNAFEAWRHRSADEAAQQLDRVEVNRLAIIRNCA